MKVATVAGVFVLIALILVLVSSKRRGRRVEAVFSGRPRLTDSQFFQTHFLEKGVSKEVSSGVRAVLSEQFGEDMSRLAASDDFTTNLKFLFEADSLVDVEIVNALEKRFGIKISDAAAQRMHTVEDLVLGVSRILANRHEA